jgi:hypothetical protein
VKREKWGWVLVWIVGNVIGGFSERLVDLWGEARTAGLYGLAGIVLGCCWYLLYPRSLIDRMRLAGIVIVAGSTFALVFGGDVSHPTVRSMIGVGVFGGLVLSEHWRPQQNTGWRLPGPTSVIDDGRR